MSAVCPVCGSPDVVEVDNPMRREVRHRRGVPCPGRPATALPGGALPDIVVDPALPPNEVQFVDATGEVVGRLRMDDLTVTVRIPHPPLTPERAIAAASRVLGPVGYLVLVRDRVSAGRRLPGWTSGWDETVLDTFDAATEALADALRTGADAMLVQLIPVPTAP